MLVLDLKRGPHADVNIYVSWTKYCDIPYGTNICLPENVYFCEWAIFLQFAETNYSDCKRLVFLAGINSCNV